MIDAGIEAAGKTYGLTGGIASGKSTVCRMFEELGAAHIDFDQLAREVVAPGKPAWKRIREYFGEEVFFPDKTLDRKKLGKIVFSDEEKRRALEEFTHEAIFGAFACQVETLLEEDARRIILAGIPLLFEIGISGIFIQTILVYIPEEEQLLRLMKREGLQEEEARKMIASQMPIDQKPGLSDYVILNDGDLDATRKQVEKLYQKLKQNQSVL